MARSSWAWCLVFAMNAVPAQTVPQPDVALITADEIARDKPADVVELLRARVGLDENNSTITMRGVKGIAIFVDGFSSSTAELKALKPEQIERIEILRGAASARFGAQAMGGAIAVTTRSARGAWRVDAVQGLDSRLGHYTRVTGSREAQTLNWSLMAEDRVTEGFRTVPDSPFPYQITVDDERSTTQTVDARLGWRQERLEVSLNFKRADNWSYFGRPNWQFDWRTDNLRTQLAWRIGDAVTLDAAAGEERYDSAGVRDRGTGIDAAGLAPELWLTDHARQREASLGLAWTMGDWQARIGANLIDLDEGYAVSDVVTRVIASSAQSTVRKRAIYVNAEGTAGPTRIEFGLRHDRQRYAAFSVYELGPPAYTITGGGVVKSATSPKLALSWPVGAHDQLRASIGTGFAPPGASLLYNHYLGSGSETLANPALKPERSTTIDLGYAHRGADLDWGLTVFATRWTDKIATRIVDDGVPVVQQAQNVGIVNAHGLEAQWSQRWGAHWSASANYTYTRTRVAEDLSNPALVGNALPDMPVHKANASLSYDGGAGWNTRARVRAVGSTYTDDANTVTDARGYRWKKAGYAVIDLSSTWRTPRWELTLALDNAFDRDYVTGFFWHQEPRTVRAELSLHF